jgi:hypothetical protein
MEHQLNRIPNEGLFIKVLIRSSAGERETSPTANMEQVFHLRGVSFEH